jgi:capsular polysaccharide biosynthesis protein
VTEPTLELPRVSVGRYLDLLRRRRWQVIPVSLLGLLVGGLVAFFIPRYYVAETVIEYSAVLADPKAEDPFEYVVDNATLMLPQAAGATMRKLSWPEGLVADPTKLHENVRTVEKRIDVIDINPGRNRTYAKLVVTYRDQDGQRAREFTDALVATWMELRVGEMRQRAEVQGAQANNRMSAALAEFDRLNREMTELARLYDFERLTGEGVQREEMRAREDAMRARRQQLDAAEGAIVALGQEIENLQRQREGTPRTVMPTVKDLETRFPPKSREAQWYAELLQQRQSIENVMGPSHREMPGRLARVAQLEKLLQDVLGPEGAEVPNPRLEELRTAIDAKQVQLAVARSTRDRLQREIADVDEERRRRIEAEPEYVAKKRALAEAEKKREEARQQLDAAIRTQEQLDSTPPIEQSVPAYVPKRPTEPDIVLVAVLGCVLGLGAAVALILLLDTLRGTLKTVDDIERALPVPVLGGLSHLETDEQRLRATASRRRTSLVAGLFLAGAVVVVTTYYVAPHRLPPFARDLLSMVLGG